MWGNAQPTFATGPARMIGPTGTTMPHLTQFYMFYSDHFEVPDVHDLPAWITVIRLDPKVESRQPIYLSDIYIYKWVISRVVYPQ